MMEVFVEKFLESFSSVLSIGGGIALAIIVILIVLVIFGHNIKKK